MSLFLPRSFSFLLSQQRIVHSPSLSRCKPLSIPRVSPPIETYTWWSRSLQAFNDGSSNHDPRLILTRVRAASTCTRGHVCQLQHRSRNIGSADYMRAAPIRRPRLYETRRARDIALSMIIRHVNSIIRSTSIAPYAISLARSIRVGDPRLLRALGWHVVRLEFCGLCENRMENLSLAREFFVKIIIHRHSNYINKKIIIINLSNIEMYLIP